MILTLQQFVTYWFIIHKGSLITQKRQTHFREHSSLHWLVLVFFYALFVQWSVLPIYSFKETKKGKEEGEIGKIHFL